MNENSEKILFHKLYVGMKIELLLSLSYTGVHMPIISNILDFKLLAQVNVTTSDLINQLNLNYIN